MTCSRFVTTTLLALGLLVVGGPRCRAQAANTAWAELGSVVAGDNGEGLGTLQAGFRVSGARPGTAHTDFAIDILPRGLTYGAIITLGDFGVGYDQALGPGTSVAVRGGASTLFGVGGGGAGFLLGYHAGAGLVVRDARGKQGVRLDFTWRRLSIDGESYPFASMTLGFMFGH